VGLKKQNPAIVVWFSATIKVRGLGCVSERVHKAVLFSTDISCRTESGMRLQ
jgi:hypothetical protein